MGKISEILFREMNHQNDTYMKTDKSHLDTFLLKRIEENREELKHNLDSTLQVEQACLEEIVKSIKHCKNNITQCNKILDKASLTAMPAWTARKEAFVDNLTIWNTLGHIQMASIEMKQCTKRLSEKNDDWALQDAIKMAYVAIYETSKKLVDNLGKITKFMNSKFPSYDYSGLKDAKKKLTKFREDNADELKHVRNNVAAHRDNDICNQLDTLDGLHLSDAVKLVVEYGNIINDLGAVVSPIKKLGIMRLE